VGDLGFLEGGFSNCTRSYIVPGKGGRSTFTFLVMQNIVEVIYVYADAVKQSIIRVKLGKLSEL